MIGICATLQIFVYVLMWAIFAIPALDLILEDRIAGLFCSSHKTLAMGIPLITAIYSNSDNLGPYTIPLLIYHPLQIVFGSFMTPRLSRMVTAAQEQRSIEQVATLENGYHAVDTDPSESANTTRELDTVDKTVSDRVVS